MSKQVTGSVAGITLALLLLFPSVLDGDISSAVLLPTTNTTVGLVIHIVVAAGLGIALSSITRKTQQ